MGGELTGVQGSGSGAGPDGVPVPDNRLADDLTARVMSAIDSWRWDNRLEHVPMDIVLRQVISMLRAASMLQEGQSPVVRGQRRTDR